MDDATIELIERIDVFRQGLEEDVPDQEAINALQEAVASLALKLHALNGGYDAQAADGFLCVETTCPGVGTDHAYGDEVCGYELEIRPKDRSPKTKRPGRW